MKTHAQNNLCSCRYKLHSNQYYSFVDAKRPCHIGIELDKHRIIELIRFLEADNAIVASKAYIKYRKRNQLQPHRLLYELEHLSNYCEFRQILSGSLM